MGTTDPVGDFKTLVGRGEFMQGMEDMWGRVGGGGVMGVHTLSILSLLSSTMVAGKGLPNQMN